MARRMQMMEMENAQLRDTVSNFQAQMQAIMDMQTQFEEMMHQSGRNDFMIATGVASHQTRAMLEHHHRLPMFSIFPWILFSCLIPPSLSYACNQHDRNSLLSISPSFSPPLNWPSNANCCLWEGIACDHNGWVTHIWLPSRSLSGGIPPSLRNLTQLSHLNLSHNSFAGPLPDDFFSSLNHLKILDLSFNRLHGELPSLVTSNGSPISLQIWDLSNNYFQGSLFQSPFLQAAWNLSSLNISKNDFVGLIPSSICSNSSLVRLLDFSFNDFSGQIPRELGKCSKLEVFRAGFNSLFGSLPADIYRMSELREISLPSNHLSGPIGSDIVRLINLTIIELNNNELNGMLPQNIGKLSNLEHLLLKMNNLSGTIPPSLLTCTNLKTLSLLHNKLGGDISTFNFSKLPKLVIVDLGANFFTGQLPVSLYTCKSLKAIRLAFNMIEGQITPDILALQSLSFLSLRAIKLTNISEAIKILMGLHNLRVLSLAECFVNEIMPDDNSLVDSVGFQNLRYLSIGFCQLVGLVPTWLLKLRKLEILILKGNQIRGPIPSFLGTLPRLFYIDLSNNFISGEFPPELTRLPTLTIKQASEQVDQMLVPLFFVNNSPLKSGIRQYNTLSNMGKVIDVSNNSLSGNIPIEIGQLKFLRYLILSQNNFSGNIPHQVSNLSNLEKLDLSKNNFSGEIPQSLEALTFLSTFNVSYNNLQGAIPLGTQLQSFNVSAYEGNPKLCGLPLPYQCQAISVDEDGSIQDEEDEYETPWFYVSMALGFITGFWAICGSLLLKPTWSSTPASDDGHDEEDSKNGDDADMDDTEEEHGSKEEEGNAAEEEHYSNDEN
ncbi:receptor-like protein 3 [Malania oleifera]|uniref:receptor-like protein 3 n=1 Tax=Malania oleifera TaxID=397392 RepID=UPI0025AE50C0|nr:receptor-like protein 3 [Malania oleifera]